MTIWIIYAIKQKHSKGLKIFTWFSILWTLVWGVLCSISYSESVLSGKYSIWAGIVDFFWFTSIISSPILAIEYYWQDKVKTKHGEMIDSKLPSFYSRILPRNVCFGLQQKISSGLKAFTLVTIYWTFTWGFASGFSITLEILEENGQVGENLILLVLMILITCGPFWVIQGMGAKRIRPISDRLEYWNNYYRRKSQQRLPPSPRYAYSQYQQPYSQQPYPQQP